MDIFLFLISTFISFLFWLGVMVLIRNRTFFKDGTRIEPFSDIEQSVLSTERLSHNEKIFKTLELFIKLTLTLIGGVVALLLSSLSDKKVLVELVLKTAPWIQLFSAIFCAIIIMSHQYSIIKRWNKAYPIWHIPLWGTSWGFLLGMAFTFFLFFIGFPELAAIASSFKS